MMEKNISCKQAVDYISKKEEGKLSLTKRFLLWKHLGYCSLCRIFSSQNNRIAKTIHAFPVEDLKLNEEEKNTIIKEVMKQDK